MRRNGPPSGFIIRITLFAILVLWGNWGVWGQVWDGIDGVPNTWNSGANWDTGSVPVAGAVVTIPLAVTFVDSPLVSLATVNITGNVNVAFPGNVTVSGTLNLEGMIGGSVTVGGNLSANALTVPAVATAFDIALNGGGTIATNVNFNNQTGTLTIGAGFGFTLGATKTVGTKSFAGTISSTATALDFGTTAVALTAATTLNGTSGAITLGAVSGAFDLILQGSGVNTIASASIGAGTLNLEGMIGGSVTVGGNLSANALTVPAVATAFDIALNGGGTIATNVNFNNQTGTLTIGAGFGFTLGATKTVGTKNFAGTISAGGAANLNFGTAGQVTIIGAASIGGTTGTITLWDTVINNGFTLNLGNGSAATILVNSVSGVAAGSASNLVINTTSTVTANGPIGTDIGDLTLSAGTLSMSANGLTVGGNISRTSGTISSTGIGTVTLNGSGVQLVDFASSTLATLAAANTGTITTSNSFTTSVFSKSGTGTFSVPTGQTLTVTGASSTISAGTLAFVGTAAYSGSTATFTVSGTGAVTVGTGAFAAGAMTVSSTSVPGFSQTGINVVDTQTVVSLTVNAGSTCRWDSGNQGGFLTITGALASLGTLEFFSKNVTVGTSITGAVEFYDLTIPASTTLTSGAATTLTVRHNMSIGLAGTYSLVNSPALILGGTNSVSGGQYSDVNGTPVNLGNLTINGAFTKTLATPLHAGALTVGDVGNATILAIAGNALTVDGLLSGTGAVTATGSQVIDIGGDISVTTLTLTGSTANVQVGGSMSTPVGNFASGTSTVIFDGATPATTLGYTFYNLTMNMNAAISAQGCLPTPSQETGTPLLPM